MGDQVITVGRSRTRTVPSCGCSLWGPFLMNHSDAWVRDGDSRFLSQLPIQGSLPLGKGQGLRPSLGTLLLFQGSMFQDPASISLLYSSSLAVMDSVPSSEACRLNLAHRAPFPRPSVIGPSWEHLSWGGISPERASETCPHPKGTV